MSRGHRLSGSVMSGALPEKQREMASGPQGPRKDSLLSKISGTLSYWYASEMHAHCLLFLPSSDLRTGLEATGRAA